MNKELFVSTTPHETKVGITEDDQLAEIYLERENEYTLAGSIYKGRVTRVLPGMQSAFVDIGLERDAFLYVSDFMDLEQTDEDLDEAIPANRPVTETRPRSGLEAGAGAANGEVQFAGAGTIPGEGDESQAASSEAPGNATSASRDFRGRRRRRGRRGETGDRGGRGERPERSEFRSEPRSDVQSEIRPEIPNEVRSESGSEPRAEVRNDQVRSDRFGRGRGGPDSRFQRPTPRRSRRSRLRLRTAPGISTDPASRRIDLEVPESRVRVGRTQSPNEGPLPEETVSTGVEPAPIMPASIRELSRR